MIQDLEAGIRIQEQESEAGIRSRNQDSRAELFTLSLFFK